MKVYVFGAIILLIGVFIFLVLYRPVHTPVQEAIQPTAQDEEMVRAKVIEFGTQLKFVSLLAPTESRKAAMDEHYAAYVAPELLAAWYPEGAEALGGYTSSPSPENIDIVEIRSDGSKFIVEGNVIEVARGESGNKEIAGTYPVTLTLEKRNNDWLIVAAQKGAYSEIPHRQTFVGFWECLPHKDPNAPHTLECAFGIALDQSDGHFAVNTMLMSTTPVDFPVGTKVRVSGVVTPANQLSSIQTYDIDGIINATTIEKVE